MSRPSLLSREPSATVDQRFAKNDAEASQGSAAQGLRLEDRASTESRQPRRSQESADPRRRFETVVTAVIVAAALGFMFVNLRPWLWVLDTTPAGGDLGAHVWSPAYLRDVLIPEWRLTGWTHDWYAGFPAFAFYMVIPSLLVVIVESGLSLSANLFAHLTAALGAALIARSLSSQVRRARAAALEAGSTARSLSSRGRRARAAALGAGLIARSLSPRGLSAAAALIMMQVLDRLDGRSIPVPVFGDVRYNDLAVDRFLAAALPVVVGLWAWRLLRAPAADDRGSSPRPGGSLGGLRIGGAPLSDFRLLGTVAAASVAVLITPMPYGVALKLVAIAGVVALPVAAYGMARLGGMAFPGPALAAAGTLPFIFDRSFNIYGGNLMSTMAGEFAYSLGLAAAVAYVGVAAKGMATGRHRVLGGILLALVGLTHLFSAFFALVATAALIAVLPWRREALRLRLRWTAITGALAAALSAWWVLPFWWNRGFLNDMGWGKERRYLSSLWSRTSFDYDFLVNHPPLQLFAVLAMVGAAVCFMRRSRLPMALALTGAFFALAFVVLPESRLWNVRLLPFYYISIYVTALIGLGEIVRAAVDLTGRLKAWRAEYGELLAARAQPRHRVQLPAEDAAEYGELLAARADPRPAGARITRWITGGSALAATAALLVMIGLPLRGLPGGGFDGAGAYQWGPFRTQELNLGSYWLEYNYTGYELKEPTADGGGASEYQHLVQTMERVGEEYGCGASLWEYEAGRLGSYGTPMAPMLLPYWTNRCIGSMEGLYFEASATTPYHFLMQSELSQSPSRAQRNLPYSGLDTAAGVEHLKLMGVRYYLAFSDAALRGARASPGLAEIAVSGPWAVFLVDDSEPVIGLTDLPVVVDDLPSSGEGWLTPAVGAFVAEGGPWLLTADGPSDWPRMTLASLAGPHAAAVAATSEQPGLGKRERDMLAWAGVLTSLAPKWPVGPPARVTSIERDAHTISFSVDRTGAPVLVRTSYFPNWKVSGAEGPYRVTPNLMVVVPTDTEVTLHYSRSGVELFSWLVTLAGLAFAGWLTWRARPSAQRSKQESRQPGPEPESQPSQSRPPTSPSSHPPASRPPTSPSSELRPPTPHPPKSRPPTPHPPASRPPASPSPELRPPASPSSDPPKSRPPASPGSGLAEIAVSGPWAVFLVDDSEPVIGLTDLPVVVDDLPSSGEGWLTPAVGAFVAEGGPWLLTADGPSDWPRMTLASLAGPHAAAVAATSEQAGLGERERDMLAWAGVLTSLAPKWPVGLPARVTSIERDAHTISFSVDRTGAPVLVRTSHSPNWRTSHFPNWRSSHFPNWKVSGAEGPYRVTPNLMVVVPTDTEVTLHYSRSSVELFSWLVTRRADADGSPHRARRSGVELFPWLVTLTGLAFAGWLIWKSRPSAQRRKQRPRQFSSGPKPRPLKLHLLKPRPPAR